LVLGLLVLTTLTDEPPQGENGLLLAYLDPGTGSIMIQGLIAAFAGGALVVKLYWRKIKRLFGRGSPDEEEVENKAAPDD
jgi:hypothetical protein